MDKIRIIGVTQGTHKLSDGTYAVGLRTKWGTLYLIEKMLPRFLAQNLHLREDFMKGDYIEAEDLIGRYIYVTKKDARRELNDVIWFGPQL